MVPALPGAPLPAATATAAGARAPAGPHSKQPPTVVLLHGLLRNASHMEPLRRCTLAHVFCHIFQMQQRRLVLVHLLSDSCVSAPKWSAMLRLCCRGVLAGTSMRLQDTLRIPLGTRLKRTPSRCSADPPLGAEQGCGFRANQASSIPRRRWVISSELRLAGSGGTGGGRD